MQIRGLLLVVTLGLMACSQAERNAKSAVAKDLLDPASAQFREVASYPRNGPTAAVCGEVNAKNRMGGYGGFRRFVYRVADGSVLIEPEDSAAIGEDAELTQARLDALGEKMAFDSARARNCRL